MATVDARLHPRLNTLLLAQGWAGLSDVQLAAWDELAAGGHALLVAPTGQGKTEAAMLPVLDRLLRAREDLEARGKPWPAGFKVLYVTPLRALNRDLLGRLQAWGEALDFTFGVRHGDTSSSERAKQSKNPPDVLITTPETVQLLLYGDRLRSHLATVRMVIVDEVHDLAASERGAQLLVALERIEQVIAQGEVLRLAKARDRPCPATAVLETQNFQRIGLSATVWDPERVAKFLAGSRPLSPIVVATQKRKSIQVVAPEVTELDVQQAGDLSIPPAAVAQLRTVRQLVQSHGRVLVFQNTRDGAELLASRSAMLDDGEPLLGLHHGSLAADHRIDVEERFRAGDLRGLVATSSLELGIDIGAIDHVVQVGSPCSVARFVQRLGRAGHRMGAISDATMVSTGAEDHLECLAIASLARQGTLEPIDIRVEPLVVLANQLVALSNEYSRLQPEWVWQTITQASVFAELDRGLFEQVWDALLDSKTLFEDDEAPGTMARGGRARRHFLDNVSLIPDEKTYRVVNEATKRTIGTVDDAFVAASLHTGASLVMAGGNWRVLDIDADHQKVRVAAAKELGSIPQWAGSKLQISSMVAAAGANHRAKPSGPAVEVVDAHRSQGLAIPTAQCITIEVGKQTTCLNVPLGTRGNETLGRLLQAMLHQRMGAPVTMQHDAYRIQLGSANRIPGHEVERELLALEPDNLDILLGLVLRDQPVIKHHLVHVAKHFGALPKDLDPNRFRKAKLDDLWQRLAMQEETLSRLFHDRMDLPAVQEFLARLQRGECKIVVQGMGPLSRIGLDQVRAHVALRNDDALLAQVRRRIEDSDVLLACVDCGHSVSLLVRDVPARLHCRRCQSVHMACLRPWHDEHLSLLRRKDSLSAEEQAQRRRMQKNAALVASFGPTACRALVGRGIGPGTASRILQKVADSASPAFWREIIGAELEFARTSSFWQKSGKS